MRSVTQTLDNPPAERLFLPNYRCRRGEVRRLITRHNVRTPPAVTRPLAHLSHDPIASILTSSYNPHPDSGYSRNNVRRCLSFHSIERENTCRHHKNCRRSTK